MHLILMELNKFHKYWLDRFTMDEIKEMAYFLSLSEVDDYESDSARIAGLANRNLVCRGKEKRRFTINRRFN